MGVMVERFLDGVSDYKLKLLAGSGGLSNSCEWFHYVENVAEVAYVNERELIFSSNCQLREPAILIPIVEQLVASRTSGLVLVMQSEEEKVAEEVISYCEAQKFPLIVMTQERNVSNVVKLFCLQILESEKANRQLFAAMKNAISFPQKTELYTPTLLQYGFRKEEPYTVVVINVEQINSMPTAEVQWIVKSIEKELLSAGDKSFVLSMDDIFVLVFSNYSNKAIRDIVLKIIVLLRMHECTFYTGVSAVQPDMYSLSSGYLQARQTIDLCRKLNYKNVIMMYDELGPYQLLLSVTDNTVKKNYYNTVLGELERYDKKNKTNYLEFLDVFLSNNCNINSTADKLFVHRNTIVYKINKIEELLDKDLSDMEVRVELYLANMLRNIL